MTHAGLVLAAGGGTRYGQPKAPVVIDGERLVDRAVRTLTAAGCNPVLVVLGAWVGRVDGADIVVNDAWPTGMGSSLAAGMRELDRTTGADSAVITLVDLPGISVAAVKRVMDAPERICVATYGGQRGHPVKLGREHWVPLVEVLVGDAGARDYLSGRGDVALVEVGDVAYGTDLDEPAN